MDGGADAFLAQLENSTNAHWLMHLQPKRALRIDENVIDYEPAVYNQFHH